MNNLNRTATKLNLEEILLEEMATLSAREKTPSTNSSPRSTNPSSCKVLEICDGKFSIPIMRLVKVSASSSNAIPEVKELADVRLDARGGDGCVWELLEWIIANNGGI